MYNDPIFNEGLARLGWSGFHFLRGRIFFSLILTGENFNKKLKALTDPAFLIVYSFSSDPEGERKSFQRVLKFLSLIFGSETSKQVKWVRNVRVDYTNYFQWWNNIKVYSGNIFNLRKILYEFHRWKPQRPQKKKLPLSPINNHTQQKLKENEN
jgi:hypothetical protein